MKALQILRSSTAFVTAAMLFLPVAKAQAPTGQPARIRVQTTSVVVDVVVTGKKGEPVTNLDLKDFKLFEDNTQQQIVGFERPPSVDARPSEPAGNAAPAGTADAPRPRPVNAHFISLVIDMGDLTPSSYLRTAKAATQYVEKELAADDYVAIYWIGSTLHAALPFTKDKARVIETIQNLKANVNDANLSSGERAKTLHEISDLRQQEASLRASGDQASLAMADMDRSEAMALQGNMLMLASFQARAVYQALRAIAQAFSPIPGRKTVVLFSEGFIPSPEISSQANAVIAAANRANVAIYVVDPKGLTGGRQEGILRAEDSSGMGPQGRGQRGRQITPDSRNSTATDLARQGLEISGGYNKFDLARRLDEDGAADDLSAIAAATGGYLFKNSNDILHSLNIIGRDIREYYTLVYHPTNDNFDGTLRKIRVEVAGSGYKVRARKGYWAMPPGEEAIMTPAAAQLIAGAANGTVKSNVKAKLNAALLLAPSGDASIPISIWIPGENSWVTKNGDLYRAGATVVVTARDPEGHTIGVHQRFIDRQWNKQQWQQFQNDGMVINESIDAPKLQAYTVQAILQFANGAGSISESKVTIPKAEKSPLILTSLLVTPRVDAVKEADETNPLQVDAYQLVLPADPLFVKSGKMTVYMAMLNYPHNATGGLQFTLSFAIKSGDGKTVRDLEPAEAHPFPKLPTGAFILTQYDLSGLSAGAYRLEAKLHDLVRDTDTVQSAPFAIQ